MHHPDLSLYKHSDKLTLKEVFYVGWLDPAFPFPKGNIPDTIATKLEKIMEYEKDINVIRGLPYTCRFCGNKTVSLKFQIRNNPVMLGVSEIWIPSDNDRYYAAPSLISHYIKAHHYLPPKEYVTALKNFEITSEWDVHAMYSNVLERYTGVSINEIMKKLLGRDRVDRV
jgi:hypothetical protein